MQYISFILEHPLFWIPIISIVIFSFLLPVKLGLIFAKTPVTWKRSWGIYFGGIVIMFIIGFMVGMILSILSIDEDSILPTILSILIIILSPYIALLFIGKIQLSIGQYILYLTGFFLVPIVLAFAIYGVRSVVSPFQVNGSAMLPTYQDRQLIMVNKLETDYKRGDVVVIMPHVDRYKDYYIKRIIALPGETIRFQDGHVLIKKENETEFKKIDEPYLSPENNGQTWLSYGIEERDFFLPEDSYWLMGDNRQNSSDSRNCFKFCDNQDIGAHFLRAKDIVGKINN